MITREETPEPDLKAMHLLSRPAPCSLRVSLADPAPGKVRDTVEVEAAFSVTMVTPFGSEVTEAELAFPGDGVPAGTLKHQREVEKIMLATWCTSSAGAKPLEHKRSSSVLVAT
jgi:hypothetical protein